MPASPTSSRLLNDGDQDLDQRNKLLRLPTEIRHRIYEQLFCSRPTPLWLTKHYRLFPSLYSSSASQADPIFETALFRCSKANYHDAITYAYSRNTFELRGDLATFCGLDAAALASMRNLSLVKGNKNGTLLESKAMHLIRNSCQNLERLEVVVQQDTLLTAVPLLHHYLDGMTNPARSPVLLLDVYVWDRHFAFDPILRDVAHSEDVMRQSVDNDTRNKPGSTLTFISDLPKQAQRIILTSDVTAGAVQALDSYFALRSTMKVTKTPKESPTAGPRALGGRSTRFWYEMN